MDISSTIHLRSALARKVARGYALVVCLSRLMVVNNYVTTVIAFLEPSKYSDLIIVYGHSYCKSSISKPIKLQQ